MEFFFITITLASSFLVFFFLYKHFFSAKRQGKRVHKAAEAWPIVGHLHLLNGTQMPHKIFGHMAEKYGPIFGIKLGVNQVVIVSDPKIAKECFITNDLALANRPKSIVSEIIGYNNAMFAFAPYGPNWRELRKMASIEFLSNKRIEMFSPIREFEVKKSMNETYEFWLKNKSYSFDGAVKIEMKERLGNLIMNTLTKMIFGIGYTDGERNRAYKAIRRFIELMGVTAVADFLPYLRRLDIGGHENAMNEIAKEMDFLVEEWLAEHKRKRKVSRIKSGDEKDFMDIMLSICEDKDFPGFDADTATKATCLTLLSGAIDTTIVTLTWTLSLILNDYQVLKKAQDELDTCVGKNKYIQEPDIKDLVYLQAAVKESLRLYPAGPLMLPHESMEDCVISGYDIPKGTRLIVNVWKIHHDPNIWSNPHEFKSERFLMTDKDVDVRGNQFELIPFGSGRRMCPGISMGLQLVTFVLAVLLHGFEFKRPSDEPIDMSESFGLTVLKSSPLEVLLTPRLASTLYG